VAWVLPSLTAGFAGALGTVLGIPVTAAEDTEEFTVLVATTVKL
jgi:hypothetical protein